MPNIQLGSVICDLDCEVHNVWYFAMWKCRADSLDSSTHAMRSGEKICCHQKPLDSDPLLFFEWEGIFKSDEVIVHRSLTKKRHF